MNKDSFKSMFIISFIKTLGLSFLFSLLSFALWIYSIDKYFLPANHYEKQVPEIVSSISKLDVLNISNKDIINNLVPSPYIEYQIFDKEGKIQYASNFTEFVDKDKNFINVINTTTYLKNNKYYKIFPLIDENDNFYAAVGLLYSLNSRSVNNNTIYNYIDGFIIYIPFIFIIIFSLYYAKNISNKLKIPLSKLSEASKKIENKELDFTIKYNGDDEFKDLFLAFERMRSSLESSLKQQWELESLRKENLSNLAHDLKTPLTVIQTYSEAILLGLVEDYRLLDYVTTINNNTNRALKMVMDINMITKVEESNYKLNPIYLSIGDFLEEKLEEYRPYLIRNGFDYEVEILDRTNSKENYYDIDAISIILDNIVSNAVTYSKANKLNINIEIKLDKVDINIIDNGIGFTSIDLNYASDKFYRGDESRKSSGSTGLGLYISNKLAKIHGGEIVLKNNDKAGARVIIIVKPIKV